MVMKRKRTFPQTTGTYDECATPAYALDILVPWLLEDDVIWESAPGEGHLVRAFERRRFSVVWRPYPEYDYFEWAPESREYTVQITNPPYSIKFDWLARAVALDKPFALLLPLECIATKMFYEITREREIQIIVPNRRIHFKMPFKGWDGTAPFPTVWITWGLYLPKDLIFSDLVRTDEHLVDEEKQNENSLA